MAVDIITARSADVIGSIDGLLMQIFVRLPVKSLIRFKLVSKHWKSLITSHHFSLLRYPRPNPILGLVYPRRKSSVFEYIHLDVSNPNKPPFRELKFPGDSFWYGIQHSCNGLLLCCSSWNDPCYGMSPIRSCYVYNPTTKCSTKLPLPGVMNGVPENVYGVNLAFDPAKSPLYKVVCVRDSEFAHGLFQIEVYSAESRVWRVSGEPFSATNCFDHGVYWNGSIHWIRYWPNKLLYFNVNEETFGNMSLPATMSVREIISYFGEFCDHLHIVESCVAQKIFDVYEMKRDYSEWFVKYRVDLTTAAAAFPDMAYVNELINNIWFPICVLTLIRVEEEGRFILGFADFW
ncbi:hypothetical protein DH2020_010186 [Rehmannia glutinosa]|uniref:F-box protein n=1 Tax=Rehmannia glutinosa TaxID=99300 RepID=A0ABR0X8E1_REHGL